MTLLKICGITNIKDRDLCLEAGVDLVGFNIYKGSVRYVNDTKLGELLSSAISKSVIVGVGGMSAANSDWEQVIKNYSPLYIQMHGNETIDIIKSIKSKFPEIKVIKKVTIGDVSEFANILSVADYLLCDTASVIYGGTGKRFDWETLKNIPKKIREKLFVAGGITVDNIGEVLQYDIFGVDVATGSESRSGEKSPQKIRQLVRSCK